MFHASKNRMLKPVRIMILSMCAPVVAIIILFMSIAGAIGANQQAAADTADDPALVNSEPASARVEQYIKWAYDFAADRSHGYSMHHRHMNPDVDCSSFIWYDLKANGFNVGNAPFVTWTMPGILQKAGFTRITSDWRDENGRGDLSKLKRGDILINLQNHTEIYLGGGKDIGAHYNYDHRPGNSDGREIGVSNTVLRENGIVHFLPVVYRLVQHDNTNQQADAHSK